MNSVGEVIYKLVTHLLGIENLSILPKDMEAEFKAICKMAFNGIGNNRGNFSRDELLTKDINMGLGLLGISVDRREFTFNHIILQELANNYQYMPKFEISTTKWKS